jgi:hypothetical protein
VAATLSNYGPRRSQRGGRGWNRTTNLSIKSRMLCQLSYASEGWEGRMLSNIQKGR